MLGSEGGTLGTVIHISIIRSRENLAKRNDGYTLCFPKSIPRPSNLLLQPQTLRIAISLHPIQAPLRANATPLVAPERNNRANLEMAIHPHRPRLHPPRHSLRPLEIIAPHASPKGHLAIIRPRQYVVLILPLQDRKNRAKRLLRHNLAILGRIVEECRCEIEALVSRVGGGDIAADDGLPALLRDLGVHVADFIVLHAVLNGADEVLRVVAGADFHCTFDVGGEGVEEFLVDGFVDVEAFDHHADLGGAEEGAYCELLYFMSD